MSLPTPSQSVSHKRFHECVKHKKKLSLRHPLPTNWRQHNFLLKFPDLWHGPGSTMRKFIGFQFILSQLELKELKDQDIFLGAMFYYRKFFFNLLFGHKFALLAFGCTCFNLSSSELYKICGRNLYEVTF